MKQPHRTVLGATILERDLLMFVRSRVLLELVVVQTHGGAYQLRARLTVEPGDLLVANVRGKPREWIRLDTLVHDIETKYGAPQNITLRLWKAVRCSSESRALCDATPVPEFGEEGRAWATDHPIDQPQQSH